MRINKHFIVLFFLICTSYAQQEFIRIWPGSAPGTEDKTNYERAEDGNITNVFQPEIKVYLPEKPDTNHPAILVLPGGGYTKVVINKEGYQIADWLNSIGIAAFVLKYRLNPEDAFNDGQRAISFIRSKAREYKIDPDKIGVIGFSAGGHLAANLATHNSKNIAIDKIDSINCKPDFLILVYGAVARFISSISKETPPTFLVHTNDDEKVSVNESIDFYRGLIKNNVPAELHVYEKGKHGFALLKDRGYVSSWAERCIEWMKGREILRK